MNRRCFLGLSRGVATALALVIGGLPVGASAADAVPAELVIDDEPIEFEDPYCPTCHDDPPPLVIETPTEASLRLNRDDLISEGDDGIVYVVVELDDGRSIRILRTPGDELCSQAGGLECEAILYAGPDWTWSDVSLARISVLRD